MGGTGTFETDRRAGVFSECQCGSYVLMDLEYEDVQLQKGVNKSAIASEDLIVRAVPGCRDIGIPGIIAP